MNTTNAPAAPQTDLVPEAFVDALFEWMQAIGGVPYDDAGRLSHHRHAINAAKAAIDDGADDAGVAAALLHDVGHLMTNTGDASSPHHEMVGAEWLAHRFPAAVTEAVRYHVDAKRYMVATEPGYLDRLPSEARRALDAQGGPMSPDEAQIFKRQPHFASAMALRRHDDRGKDPEMAAPALETHRALLLRLLR